MRQQIGVCVWGCVCIGVCVYVCMFQFGQVFVIWISFEKLMSDYNQTWLKDAIGVPSYANEVKGQVELFSCELSRYWSSGQFFVIRVSFEKLKSDDNQTWVKDARGAPSYVNEVKGHVVIFMRVAMILESKLKSNLICRCNM